MRGECGSCNFSVSKYLPFFTYFLCINLTAKVKKKRAYSVFTHRVSSDGSRKLTTFTIKLFLIIVNALRLSLKIWQGFWIHFKFSLHFPVSYVTQFTSFHFKKSFKYKPYRYLWVLCPGVFWICWRKSSKKFQNITAFKDYAKNIIFIWRHGFKVLEWIFGTIRRLFLRRVVDYFFWKMFINIK